MQVTEAREILQRLEDSGHSDAELVVSNSHGIIDFADLSEGIRYQEELYIEGGDLLDADPRVKCIQIHIG